MNPVMLDRYETMQFLKSCRDTPPVALREAPDLATAINLLMGALAGREPVHDPRCKSYAGAVVVACSCGAAVAQQAIAGEVVPAESPAAPVAEESDGLVLR